MHKPLVFEVREYKKRMVIGCSQSERAQGPQEVVFDVLAQVACDPMFLIDTWEPAFDYCDLTDAVDQACASPGDKILQEPLAFEVMTRVFEKSPHVNAVEVYTQKTQRYENTRSIGFRIELTRPQWAALAQAIQDKQQTP